MGRMGALVIGERGQEQLHRILLRYGNTYPTAPQSNRKGNCQPRTQPPYHHIMQSVLRLGLTVKFPRLPPTMKIVPVPVREDNYAYLLVDEPSKKAAAIDPWDVSKVKAAADNLGAYMAEFSFMIEDSMMLIYFQAFSSLLASRLITIMIIAEGMRCATDDLRLQLGSHTYLRTSRNSCGYPFLLWGYSNAFYRLKHSLVYPSMEEVTRSLH